MSLQEQVWARVRAGAAPSIEGVGAVAAAESVRLGAGGVRRRRADLSAQLLGLGPLEELVAEPGVSDVAVNADGSVWCDRGSGMARAGVSMAGPEEVRRLAVRLAGLAGRRLDDTAPYVDGLLPSGARLHAMLPPLVVGGAHITLRVPAPVRLSLADLKSGGSVPPQWCPLLESLVWRRVPFLISGGTGAGKTTMLAALLSAADPGERVVVVEDVRELSLDLPHIVRLEARPPNVEGRGEVSMAVLVRQALRMRPDRLVVGEVRGREVRELLTALNTGHEGGCGTVHANAVEDVVARMEALGALADLSAPAVHAQLRSAVRVVLHMRRDGPTRRLDSWGVVTGRRRCVVRRALDEGGRGPAWGHLADLLGLGDGRLVGAP